MRVTADRNMPYTAYGAYVTTWISCVVSGAEDRREECIVIAKLLGKLSFTRHYGAYGAHEWDAYAGDD